MSPYWECSALRGLLREVEPESLGLDEDELQRRWDVLRRIMTNPAPVNAHALSPELAVCSLSGRRWKRRTWRGPTVLYCAG